MTDQVIKNVEEKLRLCGLNSIEEALALEYQWRCSDPILHTRMARMVIENSPVPIPTSIQRLINDNIHSLMDYAAPNIAILMLENLFNPDNYFEIGIDKMLVQQSFLDKYGLKMTQPFRIREGESTLYDVYTNEDNSIYLLDGGYGGLLVKDWTLGMKILEGLLNETEDLQGEEFDFFHNGYINWTNPDLQRYRVQMDALQCWTDEVAATYGQEVMSFGDVDVRIREQLWEANEYLRWSYDLPAPRVVFTPTALTQNPNDPACICRYLAGSYTNCGVIVLDHSTMLQYLDKPEQIRQAVYFCYAAMMMDALNEQGLEWYSFIDLESEADFIEFFLMESFEPAIPRAMSGEFERLLNFYRSI